MATRLAPDCWLAEPAAAAPVVVPCPDGEAAGLAPEAEAAGSLDPAELARLTGAVWNFSTPSRPTRVPATTIGARFMTASLLSRSTASSFPVLARTRTTQGGSARAERQASPLFRQARHRNPPARRCRCHA